MSYKKHTKSGNRSRNTRVRDNLGTRSRGAHVKTFTSNIQDHFLSLLSIERPLFLPKKVSLEAVIQQFKEDFFVPRHSVNGAYHGDSVLAAIVKGGDREGISTIFPPGSLPFG